MRLIIEPAAGAREGRLAGWPDRPAGARASPRTLCIYARARSFFFMTGGQRCNVTLSDHFQDGEARVTSTVVGRSPLQSSYVANERDFFTLHSCVVGYPKNVFLRFLIFTISFFILHIIVLYYNILYLIVSPPFSAVCNNNNNIYRCRRYKRCYRYRYYYYYYYYRRRTYAVVGRCDGFDFVSLTLMDTIPQTRCRDDGTERYRCPTVGISRETTTAKCISSTTTPKRPLGSTPETGTPNHNRLLIVLVMNCLLDGKRPSIQLSESITSTISTNAPNWKTQGWNGELSRKLC